MYKRKSAKGLCCWHGCKEHATLRYATPGYNLQDNEEQLFCDAHWQGIKDIGPGNDESRIRRIIAAN